ncbi:MAG TPA: hypothetical protein VGA36_02980 [Nitriliruptorales bacterium]
MEASKSMLGWIVAAVLAVVLAGVLIFQAAGGDDSREAALRGQNPPSADNPPPGAEQDAQQIREQKGGNADRSAFANLPPGEQARSVGANPDNDCDPDLPPNVFAEWRNVPVNLNQASSMARDIVVATVQSTEAGQPHVSESPDGEVDSLPTQIVTLTVDERVRGNGPGSGEPLTIEALGDAEGCFRAAGDPLYEPGEQYLLLLEQGQGGRPAHTFGPGGRWLVVDGILEGMIEDNENMTDTAKQQLEAVLERLRNMR